MWAPKHSKVNKVGAVNTLVKPLLDLSQFGQKSYSPCVLCICLSVRVQHIVFTAQPHVIVYIS